MERISYLLGSVQRSLFPHLREEVGELTEKERKRQTVPTLRVSSA